MAPCHWEGPSASNATLVSPPTRTSHNRAQRRQTAQRSGWQSDASAPRTRSSAWEARSGWWSWAQKSGAVGTRERARSGPGQGPARPARPPNSCQGRLVAKVVVPVGSLSAAGRCCHSIGQYVVGAGLRQPGAWPRARPSSQLGRVVGTQPIAAAVGSRRPRHMRQTQKGPRKKIMYCIPSFPSFNEIRPKFFCQAFASRILFYIYMAACNKPFSIAILAQGSSLRGG